MAKLEHNQTVIDLKKELTTSEFERFQQLANLKGRNIKEHASYILFSYIGRSSSPASSTPNASTPIKNDPEQ